MIFWGVVGSWTAAVQYDRYEKRRIHRKYAKLVEHIAQEPLDAQQLPRKLSIYIEAPPADGLVTAREHFTEYVKPILVAAALDWDAVEGRREGDVRAGLAERIRKLRLRRGEQASEPFEPSTEDDIEALRQRSGVKSWNGPAGDIVIGRHTWKEYVRGLHEGWLGPLDPPAPAELPAELAAPAVEPTPQPTPAPSEIAPEALAAAGTVVHSSTTDDASPTATPEPPKVEETKAEENKDKKKKRPPPFNTTADYEHATLPPTCPRSLGPTAIVPLPHLLGFWNFPIRIYRFLNKRAVAEEVGRETAAAVLGAFRPFEAAGEASATGDEDSSAQWEQQRLLAYEESNWHKSVRDGKDDPNAKERIWLHDMVLDPRIAERMKRFVLEPESEERAKNINTSSEKSWLSSLWPAEKKPMWEGLTDDE